MKITFEYNDGTINKWEGVPYDVADDIENNLHRLEVGIPSITLTKPFDAVRSWECEPTAHIKTY